MITYQDELERVAAEIRRVEDARETVIDRIQRGGYTVNSKVGCSIMRKAGRMQDRIARLNTKMQLIRSLIDKEKANA